MPLREIFRLALEALLGNKFRASLTMLGMGIGVTAIVLLVSLGNGAKNYILNQFEDLGTNLIVVQPGKSDKKTQFGPPIGSSQRKMTMADVAAIQRNSFNLEAVTGVLLGTTTVRYGESIVDVSVLGCGGEMLKIFNLKVENGEFFSTNEDDYGRRLVVLGANVGKNVFGDENPVGRRMRVHQSEFRVIGVMQKSGQKLGFNLDDFVFIPTTAAMRVFNDDKLFGIRAKARSRSAIEDGVAEISNILKSRRNGDEDFTIVTQLAMMDSMETILGMLTYVLAGIATISMLVAGIGIMNIMLVNVSERTQEIGIRRAVGARRSDILKQFLAEAVALSLLGGSAGLFVAIAVTQLIFHFLPEFDLRAPWWILPPAFLVSLFVGVIFGVWPARKASKIETLEALRHEG